MAKLNDLRIAPRKVRLIADLIRNQDALAAKARLDFLAKKGAKPLAKLLNSALANARNNFQLDEKDLYLAKVLVDEGRKLKRWRPRARGQAYPIQKKTSQVTIVLQARKAIKAVPKTKKSEPGKRAAQAKTKTAKPKIRPATGSVKPKSAASLKRVFRRKAF